MKQHRLGLALNVGIWRWESDDVGMLQDLYGVSWGGDRRLSRVTVMWHCDVTQNVTPDTVMGHGHCEMRGDHPRSSVIITTNTIHSHREILDGTPCCHHMILSSLPGPSNIICYMTSNTLLSCSLLMSRPWFFCHCAEVYVGRGSGEVGDVIPHTPHHSLECRTRSPTFANIRQYSHISQSVIRWSSVITSKYPQQFYGQYGLFIQ